MSESEAASPSHEVIRALAALSDQNRFRIVELLSACGDPLSCGTIGAELGLSPSLISHHLAILEGAGLVDRRKAGSCTLNRLRRDELLRHVVSLERLLRPNGAR